MIHLGKGIPKVELLDSASIHFMTLFKFISSLAYLLTQVPKDMGQSVNIHGYGY